MAKICNINFWIGNDPSPFRYFSENSSVFEGTGFPYNENYDDDDCEGEKTIANLCIKVGREGGQSDNTVAKMMPTDGGVIISMMIIVMMT